MIDTLAILGSCLALALVAWRALLLDRVEPWFGPPPAEPGDRTTKPAARGQERH